MADERSGDQLFVEVVGSDSPMPSVEDVEDVGVLKMLNATMTPKRALRVAQDTKTIAPTELNNKLVFTCSVDASGTPTVNVRQQCVLFRKQSTLLWTGLYKRETNSDIVIEDESSIPSRSSSPEIEVLEVRKSTIRFTVDLTLDDDESESMDNSVVLCRNKKSESKIAPYRRQQASARAPLLDISSEDRTYAETMMPQLEPEMPQLEPEMPQLEQEHLIGSPFRRNPTERMDDLIAHFHPRELGIDGNQKTPRLDTVSVKQETDDTLNMLEELESIIGCQPKVPFLSSASEDGNLTKNSLECNRFSGVNPNPELSSGSGRFLNSANFSDRVGKSSVSGPSSSVNSFCDMPLDMSSRTVLASKESVVRNLNTPPITVPAIESASHSENPYASLFNKNFETGHSSTSLNLEGMNFDPVDFAIEKAGLSSDFKAPIPTHPNSAFQAVTPGTSSSLLSDPLNLMSNPQAASNPEMDTWTAPPMYSSTSTISDGNIVHSTSNYWNPPFVPNLRGQRFDALNSLVGIATQLFPLPSSSQGIGFPTTNSEGASSALHSPQYSAGPSTSNCNYNQGGKSNFLGFVDQSNLSPSQQMSNIPSILPVLSPNTVIEHTSNFVGPSLQSGCSASTSYKSASTDGSKDSGNKTAAESSVNHPPDPPSPEEPTFSCNICLDSVKTIQSSSRNLCSTVCGHVFCSACLEAALKRKKECPLCRKRLGKKQYHPLFL